MVYIYQKIVGGKPYYYLRISKRVKNKNITKDIAYLGDDVAKILVKLENLPAQYKAEIRNSFRHIKNFVDSHYYLDKVKEQNIKSDLYINRELLENVEAIKLHFNKYFLKQNSATIRETYKNFIIEFAYNTASLEGNTITLKEAEKLLKENLAPKEKTMREIFDLQNTEKVFFHLLDTGNEINHQSIIEIHDMLMENIDVRKGYRTHEIRVFKSHFDSSPVMYIKTDMDLLLKWYNKYKNKLHPLVLGAMFHHKFERIHPFSDGNGRAGRMILNHILMRNGYPPLIIKKQNRSEYLKQLAKADKSKSNAVDVKYYSGLVNYAANEFVDSYWNNFNI